MKVGGLLLVIPILCLTLLASVAFLNTSQPFQHNNNIIFSSHSTPATTNDNDDEDDHGKEIPFQSNILLPINEFLQSTPPFTATCPPGTQQMNDTHLPESVTHENRLIPRIVHLTSKSRCMTPEFAANIDSWRLEGHSFYFHDENAVDRLLSSPHAHAVFPDLKSTSWCARGATKSDLWRYIVLYLYGGIYTDIDNAHEKFDSQTITSTDDAWFPLEALGVPAQYFLASSPLHPMMAHSLLSGIGSLRATGNLMMNTAPFTTGPRAVKMGFIDFMAANGVVSNGYPLAGMYTGSKGRNCTIVGDKAKPQEYVRRSGVSDRAKVAQYSLMGMKQFRGWNNLVAIERGKEGYDGKGVSCEEYVEKVEEDCRKIESECEWVEGNGGRGVEDNGEFELLTAADWNERKKERKKKKEGGRV